MYTPGDSVDYEYEIIEPPIWTWRPRWWKRWKQRRARRRARDRGFVLDVPPGAIVTVQRGTWQRVEIAGGSLVVNAESPTDVTLETVEVIAGSLNIENVEPGIFGDITKGGA